MTKQNARQATVKRQYPPTENNKPMETLQTKQIQRATQFLVSQHFGVVYAH